MGHGIAQVSAMAGYNVVLRDIEQKFLDKAMEKVKWSLDKLVSKEKISQDQANDIYSRIKPVVDLKDAVKDCERHMKKAHGNVPEKKLDEGAADGGMW